MFHKIFYKYYALAFARKRFYGFNLLLLKLGLRGIGVLNYTDFKVSGEKYFIQTLLKNYKITTIFDVGAHIGKYAKLFCNKPEYQVYSFEPSPVTFLKLKDNLVGEKNVRLFNFGFSDTEETSVLYDYENQTGSSHASLYKEVIDDTHHGKSTELEIELKTLDNFVAQHEINNIDLLKIDAEGNEYKILKGAEKSLVENKVGIIHFEFNEMNTISRIYMKDFFELLNNFDLYRLLPGGLLPLSYTNAFELEIFAFQNIIAINKNLRKR